MQNKIFFECEIIKIFYIERYKIDVAGPNDGLKSTNVQFLKWKALNVEMSNLFQITFTLEPSENHYK